MGPSGVFTLGGVLAHLWCPAYPLLPWALTSALLMAAGMWDYWSTGGAIEWIVVGLSAYELMIGLMEEDRAEAVSHARSPKAHSRTSVDV